MSSSVEASLPIVPLKTWPPIVTPVPDGSPSMPPTWPQATWMPTPVRNPMRTVRDRKSARNAEADQAGDDQEARRPSRRARRRAPRTRCDPDAASPANPAAMTAAVAESAPTTRWRDEPKTAKTRTGSRIV